MATVQASALPGSQLDQLSSLLQSTQSAYLQQQQRETVSALLSMQRQGFAEHHLRQSQHHAAPFLPTSTGPPGVPTDPLARLVTATGFVEAQGQDPAAAASSCYMQPSPYAPLDGSRAPSAHSSAAPSPYPDPAPSTSQPYHQYPLTVKTEGEEGVRGPSSHVSSVDSMEGSCGPLSINPYLNQEEAKIERKRQRNRIAASKCRYKSTLSLPL